MTESKSSITIATSFFPNAEEKAFGVIFPPSLSWKTVVSKSHFRVVL